MSRRTIFALAMLAALCTPALVARAQDRAQIAAEIESLRGQIKAKEPILLAPAREDFDAHAEFLALPKTGIVRLLPREKWDGKLSTRGGGAYYSFTRLTHEYGFGSDIGMEQDYFSVGFGGADFGFLVNIGDVPIESVTTGTDGVRYLALFDPPRAEPGARVEQRRTGEGFVDEHWTYKSRLPVVAKQTYVVRSVDYGGSDVLVAFRVVRKDADGSVILLWKMLKKFDKPVLERTPAAAASAVGP
jgi:hypothetical protein